MYKIHDSTYARKLAKQLLEINAVLLRPNNPFTWSSGWNSPIYCDNRKTLRFPDIRTQIAEKLVESVQTHQPDIDVITGTATAGIPHATLIADRMEKPLAYVRAKHKSYGLGKKIEGGVDKGQTSVVIEDLISTGNSALTVVDTLKFIGANVPAVFTIFTYGFDKSNEQFKEANTSVHALTDFSTLTDVAQKEGYIEEEDIQLLNQWRAQPETWPN